MKKVLLSIFAVAALASCFQNEDIVSTSDSNAIKFDSYVGNTTKAIDPSVTKATLQSFQVWGTTQGDHTLDNGDAAAIVPIFTDLKVKKEDGVWKYNADSTAYWIPGNTYNFAAVVNANVDRISGKTASVILGENGLPATIVHTLTSLGDYNDKDLLYAEVKDVKGENKGNVNGKVAFTFDHLLSKVVFTFTNTSTDPEGNIYVVKNIRIRNCVHMAKYDVATGAWTAELSTMEKEFGDIVATNDATTPAEIKTNAPLSSKYERFLIPVPSQTVEITCVIDLYVNGEVKPENLADEIKYSHTIDLKMKPGYSYNFALSAGLTDKVEFDVTEVEGWKPGMTPNPGTPDHNN